MLLLLIKTIIANKLYIQAIKESVSEILCVNKYENLPLAINNNDKK